MTGPRCHHTTLAGLEYATARCLEAQAALMGAMRGGLRPTMPPKALRACLAAVRAALRLLDRVNGRPPVFPEDARPEAVRADAEIRTLARTLREQAEPLALRLPRRLRAHDAPRRGRSSRPVDAMMHDGAGARRLRASTSFAFPLLHRSASLPRERPQAAAASHPSRRSSSKRELWGLAPSRQLRAPPNGFEPASWQTEG